MAWPSLGGSSNSESHLVSQPYRGASDLLSVVVSDDTIAVRRAWLALSTGMVVTVGSGQAVRILCDKGRKANTTTWLRRTVPSAF
jgi:hypothetical protein